MYIFAVTFDKIQMFFFTASGVFIRIIIIIIFVHNNQKILGAFEISLKNKNPK